MSKKIFGIDFGTNAMKIYKKGEGIVLDEKTVIAIANRKKVIAVGNEAYEMLEKSPTHIQVSHPVRNGVIADVANMQSLLNYFFQKQLFSKGRISTSDYLIAVPTDITDVEKRAFFDIVSHSNGKPKSIGMVEKPIAAALGIGLDVTNARGVMTVDIGADTTEIAIMSLGGIVLSKLLSVGGNRLDESIKLYVKKRYNLIIGDKTAEVIKKELASAYETKDSIIKVYGRDIVRGLPSEMEINSSMVYSAIKEHLHTVIDSIKMILERTPPEISADIIDSGIYITGGSANIKRLGELVSEETDLKVNICDNSLKSVANGLGVIIEDANLITLATTLKQQVYIMKGR